MIRGLAKTALRNKVDFTDTTVLSGTRNLFITKYGNIIKFIDTSATVGTTGRHMLGQC